MSEQEQETQEPVETPDVEPGADEPGGEELEGDESGSEQGGDGEQGGEPGGDGEQPQDAAAPLTEKEIERAYKKLESLRTTNARRIGEILKEDAQVLVPCPVCSGFAPGFVWPREVSPPSEEAVAGMRALMGDAAREQLKPHPDAEPCETCDCLGQVVTPSHVPGYDVVPCPSCSGAGRHLRAATVTNGSTPTPIVTGPTVTGPATPAPELTPELQSLREQGWLIAPPVQVG